jgi:hypothetical protein
MDFIEPWLFLGFLSGWIVFISTGIGPGCAVHAMPLIAVGILVNSIRRRAAEAPVEEVLS